MGNVEIRKESKNRQKSADNVRMVARINEEISKDDKKGKHGINYTL